MMNYEEYKITLSLSVEQVNRLAGLTALVNACNDKRGFEHYSESDVLKLALEGDTALSKVFKDCEKFYSWLLGDLQSEDDEKTGDVPARNPSPEEATPPQLVKDRTDEYFNYLEHGSMPEDSHETLIPVVDADGVHRMATLDEVEDMREAAQGIYNGAPPEPKEPEDFRDKGYLYDPAHYEGDACECGSIVVSDPESLAFVDALFEALYR